MEYANHITKHVRLLCIYLPASYCEQQPQSEQNQNREEREWKEVHLYDIYFSSMNKMLAEEFVCVCVYERERQRYINRGRDRDRGESEEWKKNTSSIKNT